MSLFIRILFRNVITHSPCVVCVWILWWSRILCSREQMARWIPLMNLVLKDTGTQCSDIMWHWGMGLILIAWCSEKIILLPFILLLNLSSFVNLNDLVLSWKCFWEVLFDNSKANVDLFPTWIYLRFYWIKLI